MRKQKIGKKITYILEKKEENFSLDHEAKEDRFFQRRSKDNPAEIKKEIKIKEKIEIAQNTAEKKDLFEKILIERIAANPKDIEAYERLGEYYMEIENWNYAKECFKQVLRLNPSSTNVRSKMRELERLLGKYPT